MRPPAGRVRVRFTSGERYVRDAERAREEHRELVRCELTAHGYPLWPPFVDYVEPEERDRRERIRRSKPIPYVSMKFS